MQSLPTSVRSDAVVDPTLVGWSKSLAIEDHGVVSARLLDERLDDVAAIPMKR